MAVDKDPSIYHDRGSIGSDDDLDEYGVWVKSEPQVVTDTTSTGAGVNDEDLFEPGLPDIEELPDLALDSNDMVSDALAESELIADSETETLSSESSLSDIPDLDDFASFGLPEDDFSMEETSHDASSSDATEFDESAFDLPDMESLDDEESSMTDEHDTDREIPAVESSTDFEDGEISLDEFGVDFDVDPSGSTPESSGDKSSTSPVSSSSQEEVSMDEFIDPSDFGFDSEPVAEVTESDEPSMDIDLEFTEEESTGSDEFDSSDIFDNIIDETPATTSDSMSLSGMDDLDIEEVGDFDSFLNGSDTQETAFAAESTASTNLDESAEGSGFEDIDIGIEIDDDEDSPFMSEDARDAGGFDELNVRLDEEDASLDAELDAALPEDEEHFDDLAALGRDLEESDNQKLMDTAADDDFAAALAESDMAEEAPLPDGDDLDFAAFSQKGPATEEEDSSIPEEPVAASKNTAGSDSAALLSTQLLMRIADELSSIKNEITALKTELSVLKEGAVAASVPEEDDSQANGGFFADEEDEKIALTGDELDNILNTANFTEEDGADAGVIDDFVAPEDLDDDVEIEVPADEEEDMNLDIDSAVPGQEAVAEECEESSEFLSDLPDILGDEDSSEDSDVRGLDSEVDVVEHIEEDLVEEEEEEASFSIEEEEPADVVEEETFDELDLTEAFSLDGESHEADEKLIKLAEEGVQPLTPAPEDSSYLDDEVDLSEAVIEEPDLGDITFEEPVMEEPALDEIILDEGMGVSEENFSEGPLAEMDISDEEEENISIPATSESFEDIVPEDFSIDTGDENVETMVQEDVPLMEEADSEADVAPVSAAAGVDEELPANLKNEVKAVLAYMDQLLESLPEDKIEEFAKSEYFDTYKKLFEELGLS